MDKKLKTNELQRKTVAEFKAADKAPIVVLLDNVRSLHNVGSVFRTCDAFAVKTLYLCGITGIPPNKEINKTALGATESVNWQHTTDVVLLINNLRQEGYKICVVEQTQKSVYLHKYPVNSTEKYALIFGNEVDGVQQTIIDVCDTVIEIGQEGTKHSLNIAVSAGIVLWEFFKAREN